MLQNEQAEQYISLCLAGADDQAHCHGRWADRGRQVSHSADPSSLPDQNGQAYYYECPQPQGTAPA